MYNPTNDNDMNGNYYNVPPPPPGQNMGRRPQRGSHRGQGRFGHGGSGGRGGYGGRGGFSGRGGYGGRGGMQYELLPEFELEEHPNRVLSKDELLGDPAAGWERDDQSFTKKVGELHLKMALN